MKIKNIEDNVVGGKTVYFEITEEVKTLFKEYKVVGVGQTGDDLWLHLLKRKE